MHAGIRPCITHAKQHDNDCDLVQEYRLANIPLHSSSQPSKATGSADAEPVRGSAFMQGLKVHPGQLHLARLTDTPSGITHG